MISFLRLAIVLALRLPLVDTAGHIDLPFGQASDHAAWNTHNNAAPQLSPHMILGW